MYIEDENAVTGARYVKHTNVAVYQVFTVEEALVLAEEMSLCSLNIIETSMDILRRRREAREARELVPYVEVRYLGPDLFKKSYKYGNFEPGLTVGELVQAGKYQARAVVAALGTCKRSELSPSEHPVSRVQ